MKRVTTTLSLLLCSFISVPQAAHAADFGFVRWPSFLDLPIFVAVLITGLLFGVFKTQIPRGYSSYAHVPKEERTPALKITTYLMAATFTLCMLMMFAGMGLQRATELLE